MHPTVLRVDELSLRLIVARLDDSWLLVDVMGGVLEKSYEEWKAYSVIYGKWRTINYYYGGVRLLNFSRINYCL